MAAFLESWCLFALCSGQGDLDRHFWLQASDSNPAQDIARGLLIDEVSRHMKCFATSSFSDLKKVQVFENASSSNKSHSGLHLTGNQLAPQNHKAQTALLAAMGYTKARARRAEKISEKHIALRCPMVGGRKGLKNPKESITHQ